MSKVSDSEALRLASLLVQSLLDGEWHTRRQLKWGAGSFMGNCTLRELRIARAACKGQVICGQKGHKLTSKASPQEVSECLRELKRMAGEILKQALMVEAVVSGAHDKTVMMKVNTLYYHIPDGKMTVRCDDYTGSLGTVLCRHVMGVGVEP